VKVVRDEGESADLDLVQALGTSQDAEDDLFNATLGRRRKRA
jgi:hypothetical protein